MHVNVDKEKWVEEQQPLPQAEESEGAGVVLMSESTMGHGKRQMQHAKEGWTMAAASANERGGMMV